MASNVTPHQNDVLFGRGSAISAHPGNRHLRSVTQACRPDFLKATKKEKQYVAQRVVDEIERLDPPGRFLMEGGCAGDDIPSRLWLPVERKKALGKVMHLLREKERPSKKSSEHGSSISNAPSDDPTTTMQNTQEPISNDGPRASDGQADQNNDYFTQHSKHSNGTNDGDCDDGHLKNHQQPKTPSCSNCQHHGSPNERAGVQPKIGSLIGSPKGSLAMSDKNNMIHSDLYATNMQAGAQENVEGELGSDAAGSPPLPSRTTKQSTKKMSKQQFIARLIDQKYSVRKSEPHTNMGSAPERHSEGCPPLSEQKSGYQSIPLVTEARPQCAHSPGASKMTSTSSRSRPSPFLLITSPTGGSRNIYDMPQPPSGSSSSRLGDGSPILQSIDKDRISNQRVGDIQCQRESKGSSGSSFLSTSSIDQFLSSGRTSPQYLVSKAEPASDNLLAREVDGSDALVNTVSDYPTLNQRQRPAATQHPWQVVTLRQWIDRSSQRLANPTSANRFSKEGRLSYIKSAIPLALDLAGLLLEAENGTNPIPLASITSDNVIVFVKYENTNDNAELVDRVEIMKSASKNQDDGGHMPRLFALGAILYEVFSQRPFPRGGPSNRPSATSTSVGGLSLDDKTNESPDDPPSKRSQRKSSPSERGGIHGESIAQLEMLSIPRSVCALIGNLLDCSNGDFCGDDAYRSLSDVRTDLKLMRDDPACFLHDQSFGANPSFEIRPKFYGREADVSKIVNAYLRHKTGDCGGILVAGGAGVGKSSLVTDVLRKVGREANCYFLQAKFDQNKSVNPLNKIGAIFNKLCDSFAKDTMPSQLMTVSKSLETALGSQAGLLLGVVPNLAKLTSCSTYGTSIDCVDVAASMRYLFVKLLEVLSYHKGVAFLFDDLQWADPASLTLIASMVGITKESGNVFFACCYRDEDIKEGDPFATWLAVIKVLPLETLHLQNISKEGVNELLSETLHLFPRVTRPLATILHHKTRGNPLFMRQLLKLWKDQGCISFSISSRHWTWDMDKIMNLEISDSVLALVMKEMQRLPADLQLGLKVASCLGSSVKYSIFDILSQSLGVNLRALLDQAVQKGFMVKVDESCIRFSHDKIQQAAYEMMPIQERLQNHMRFGLTICSRAVDTAGPNEELFFVAINQINRGGPDSLPDPNRKVMVAGLNLKAGRRSIELSDLSTALKLFEHGISFLDSQERWTAHYSLSLDLFDGAAEVACNLNDAAVVGTFSREVGAQAKCDEDKLNCLSAVCKSLRVTFKLMEAKKIAFEMLQILGEKVLRPSDDIGLARDLEDMKFLLKSMSDESILNMGETSQAKKDVLSLNIYHDLLFLFHLIDTKRIADAGLRMARITMSNGLCSMSAVAFAQFSVVLVEFDAPLAYRLSKLALRLLCRTDTQRYTSAVIVMVGTGVSWVAEPLQSISESHLIGYNHGQRGGDVVSANMNYMFYLQIIYLAGQKLSDVREKIRVFSLGLLERKQHHIFYGLRVLYLQTVAFIKGLDFVEEEDALNAISSSDITLKPSAGKNSDALLVFSTHQYMRSFLFKQYDNLPEDGILDCITEKDVPLRPIFYYGIFFEALTSFHLMRQTNRDDYRRKGEAALAFMRKWSKCNKWNFENKYLLLEAEMIHSCGYHQQAAQLYEQSILSSNKHKFVHDEAVACEVAAIFFYKTGLHQKAYSFFVQSVNCYEKWGASSIAKRLEKDMQSQFGTSPTKPEPFNIPSKNTQKRCAG
ncbi:hypothetical protein ACHAWF_017906 [Thalassiosira exigua]